MRENRNIGAYVPNYIRISHIERDQDKVQEAIDSYTGMFDLTLSEDQARDVEWGLIEYETYYPADYVANEWGTISVPSIRFDADPLGTPNFQTDGGQVYIGIGTVYDLRGLNSHPDGAAPGDTALQKCVFTVLKNYDESEYIIKYRWLDENDSGHDLYFAAQ
jgi:hypothetical protein